jgi:hypothetical protein
MDRFYSLITYVIGRRRIPLKEVRGAFCRGVQRRNGEREGEKMKILWGVLVAVLLLAGCARIEIRPLTSEERANEGNPDKASKLNGVRFFRSSPYLLVRQTDTNGSCDVAIVYYQNVDEPYIIIPHWGIGSITYNPTLTDGWNLTGFSGTVDSKVPEMIGSVAGLMTAAVKAATPGARLQPEASTTSVIVLDNTEISVGQPLGPGMYKITFGKDGTKFKRVFGMKSGDSFQPCRGFSSPPRND